MSFYKEQWLNVAMNQATINQVSPKGRITIIEEAKTNKGKREGEHYQSQ